MEEKDKGTQVDRELEALEQIAIAMAGLSPTVQRRVALWVNDRYATSALGTLFGQGLPPQR